MIVRKVRGEDRIEKIILHYWEVEACKKMDMPVELYAKKLLLQIAKKRRWKWYLNKEKS